MNNTERLLQEIAVALNLILDEVKDIRRRLISLEKK